MNQPAGGRTSRFSAWASRAKQYPERAKQHQEKLEREHPWVVGFPFEAFRRFNKIEGKHLAIVIALNMFVAIIPLIIIGYAFIEAFNPHRDVGSLLAAVMGVYWERKAGPAAVATMEELSAEISASEA